MPASSMRSIPLFSLFALTALTLPAADDPIAAARAAWKAGDYSKAGEVLTTPAAAESTAALVLRGQKAETGRGAPHSHAEALKLYRQAMDKGNEDAMAACGRYLISGTGGSEKDPEKGLFLIRKAAESGSGSAMALLGDFALNGVGQEPDPKAAAFWYQRASAKMEPIGFLGLARLYDAGTGGLIQDEARGTSLVLDAARLGEPQAMHEMGLRYQAGRGVLRDNVAAVGWFSMAVQYELPAAMVQLGNCYETGNGCLNDIDKAGRQYAAAAKLGFPAGQFMLGSLFERGAGIKPNPVFAYVNYTRAAAGGYKEAEAKRDNLKATLTPTQLVEATKLLAGPEQ